VNKFKLGAAIGAIRQIGTHCAFSSVGLDTTHTRRTANNQMKKDKNHQLVPVVFNRTEWEESPFCLRCSHAMVLEDGCEWPDDARLLLCRNCLLACLGERLGHEAGIAELISRWTDSAARWKADAQFHRRAVSNGAAEAGISAERCDTRAIIYATCIQDLKLASEL
jgi:hypothetical protein